MTASDDTRDDGAAVLPLVAPEQAPPGAAVVGWLVASDRDTGLRVDWPGNDAGPVAARSTISVSQAQAAEAIESRRGVVLLFERNDPALPIITGLLVEGPTVDAQLPDAAVNATVDGRRVVVTGDDEVVLRCGDASIVMRRNGRVIIRGTYVETRSSGTNRIKGGSVQIN